METADNQIMSGRSGVSVRQRRVSAELREWRTKAGLTCKQVADALDVSVAKVSRMETGERGLFADDVSALLGLYRVPQQRRLELLEMVRNCHEPNWWQIDDSTANLPTSWREVIDCEARAAAIVNFETLVIPGLLQTNEYAAAVLHGTMEQPSDDKVNRLVATRIGRSAVLSKRAAPKASFILDEAVLRRPVGGHGVMERQLNHLLTLARQPNVCIQVLPFAAGATPGLEGPTAVYDLRSGDTVVYVEMRGASSFFSEDSVIRRARVAMRRLGALALAPAESALMIADAAHAFRSAEE